MDRAVLSDAGRLSLGTLSIVRVRPPKAIDRRRAGWAMAFAPLVAGLLAAVVGAAGLALQRSLPAQLEALILLGLLTILTRAIHLDGLADVADGLGSGKDADAARAVMKRSDIGPFGVLALLFVLGVQWLSLSALLAQGRGIAGLALALVVSRLVLAVLCLRGIPAATTTGLGRYVANTVGGGQLMLSGVLAVVVVVVLWLIDDGFSSQRLLTASSTTWAVLAGLGVGTGLGVRCVRRFGGVTGDVLGACAEVAFAAALLAALAAG